MSHLSIVQLLFVLYYISQILHPLTVTVHELGHAIPSLFFTKGQVKLYIGTYDKEAETFHFTLGRLEFFYSKKPFDWGYGMCQASERTSAIKEIIITLGGSVFSVVFGIIAFCFALFLDLHDFWRILLFAFFASSLRDFYHNLLTKSNGTLANDRDLLEERLQEWSVNKKYQKGYKLYYEGKYAESLKILLEVLEKEKKANVYHTAISAAIDSNDVVTASRLFEEQSKVLTLKSTDFNNISRAYMKIGNYTEAVKCINTAIKLDPRNAYAYNNRGYTLCRLGRFAEAEQDLDKAILLADVTKEKEVLPAAYNTRGFAKLHLQKLEEALQDIKYTLSFQPKNNHAHRNLGIYYYEKGAFSEAQIHFENCLKLNDRTEFAKDYLTKIKEKL